MVSPCQSLAHGALHQTRKGRQNVDRLQSLRGAVSEQVFAVIGPPGATVRGTNRIDLLVMQLTVDKDLTLGNVAREIWNGVSDICQPEGDQI
jgi:hypothetical protein